MHLTASHMDTYQRDGLLVVPSLFSLDEVDILRGAFERDAAIPGEHRISEPGGSNVRAVYASHQRQAEYAALVRSPRVLGIAQQLLGPNLYVYQFKINAKSGFGGDSWAWHQDYLAWRIADNLPAPREINVALFLDDVDEFNGPVMFVPGSHKEGAIHTDRNDAPRSDQHLDPDDIALSQAEMSSLVNRYGMVSPKGLAGSVVFFHPEIVHGSAPNMSPFSRRLLIMTFNEVDNIPVPLKQPRPEYLVGRDTRPLQVANDPLVAEKASVEA